MKFLLFILIYMNLYAVQYNELFQINFQKKDRIFKINKINYIVNQYRYVPDIVNYNKKDYWATPFEFFKNRGGDCEDFAITKLALLRDIGIKDKMYFRVFKLKNKNHLTLLIKEKDHYLELDNNLLYVRKLYGINKEELRNIPDNFLTKEI